MVSRVLDYLLVTTDPGPPVDASTGAQPAGWTRPVTLEGQLWFESPDGQLAERLLEACEFRGERWHPQRQFGVAQALVREVDPTDPRQRHLYAWDQDQTIYVALALSRLVRPHAIGCDHAVRRIVDIEGPGRLVPYDAGEARVAFRIDDESRGWLDSSEASQLCSLLAAYDPESLPGRVRRAIWLCELTVRERYLEDALPLIVAGLEALLKVGRGRLTAQFTQRTAALSGHLSTGLDEAQCERAYDDRSAIVHGTQIDLSRPVRLDEFVSIVSRLQQTLRAAVRRAIEDREFCAIFEADEAIRARWPLRP